MRKKLSRSMARNITRELKKIEAKKALIQPVQPKVVKPVKQPTKLEEKRAKRKTDKQLKKEREKFKKQREKERREANKRKATEKKAKEEIARRIKDSEEVRKIAEKAKKNLEVYEELNDSYTKQQLIKQNKIEPSEVASPELLIFSVYSLLQSNINHFNNMAIRNQLQKAYDDLMTLSDANRIIKILDDVNLWTFLQEDTYDSNQSISEYCTALATQIDLDILDEEAQYRITHAEDDNIDLSGFGNITAITMR